MNLHIENAEAHRLAVELARQTGESIADAVTKAIRAELKRLAEIDRRRKAIDAIIAVTAPIMRGGPGSADIDALLYDDMGLPK
jgi:hypothetical protein